MAETPKDFQQQLKLYNQAGLDSSYGKFKGTGDQQDALTNYLRGGGSSSGGSSANNFQDIIKRTIEMTKNAVKPAVESLQGGIPEVQSRFSSTRQQLEAEKTPLKARYDDLLNRIKGNQQTAENRQTVATQNELGRRGILTQSGVGEQEMANALNPITSEYSGLITDTGFQREADLRNLTNQITNLTGQETDAVRAIQNAIAQLQSGAVTGSAIPTALSLLNLGQNQQQFDTSTGLQKAQQALAERQFTEATLPQVQYAINAPYYKPDASSSSGISSASDFLKLFGFGGNTGSQSPWEIVK